MDEKTTLDGNHAHISNERPNTQRKEVKNESQ